MMVAKIVFLKAAVGFLLFFLTLNSANSQVLRAVSPALPALQDLPNIRDFTMRSDGNEAYITIKSPQGAASVIARVIKHKGEWHNPQIASFSGRYGDLEPFLSPDGLRLYFVSNRPVTDTSIHTKDYDIWYVERENTEAQWGNPVNPGAPVNTEMNEFYPAVSRNGNLYYTCEYKHAIGKEDIFYCRWNGQQFDPPVALDSTINSAGYEFNAFISPDEDLLIFSGYERTDGFGGADLYLSFRDDSNGWTPAVNLGSVINSGNLDYCPFYDEISEKLYFTSNRSVFNEADAIQSMDDFRTLLNQYENGFSRVYMINFAPEQYRIQQ